VRAEEVRLLLESICKAATNNVSMSAANHHASSLALLLPYSFSGTLTVVEIFAMHHLRTELA